MEIIDKDNLEKIWDKNWVENELFDIVEKWKWAELRQLLEWYFSMINHLEDIGYLSDNIECYNKTLSELIKFSKDEFMEKSVWRVSDNGKNQETCWAHLRNLLSPFKNMIALIRDFSGSETNQKILKSFIEHEKLVFIKSERNLLKLCDFISKI